MNEVYVNSRRASLAEPHRNAATAAGVWGYQFVRNSGAATASGDRGAMASGHEGRVSGILGAALFLVYRDPHTDKIVHAWSGIVGHGGVKPDTWYMLDSKGNPQETTLSGG